MHKREIIAAPFTSFARSTDLRTKPSALFVNFARSTAHHFALTCMDRSISRNSQREPMILRANFGRSCETREGRLNDQSSCTRSRPRRISCSMSQHKTSVSKTTMPDTVRRWAARQRRAPTRSHVVDVDPPRPLLSQS